jgi:hypothetical protein
MKTLNRVLYILAALIGIGLCILAYDKAQWYEDHLMQADENFVWLFLQVMRVVCLYAIYHIARFSIQTIKYRLK